MWWNKKKQRQSRSLTGVQTVLSAAHRDQTTGKIHGHTWVVIAWFDFRGIDQFDQHKRLCSAVEKFDHTCLPDKIAWAENLAKYTCMAINNEYDCWDCVAVDVNRPSEGIYARFEL